MRYRHRFPFCAPFMKDVENSQTTIPIKWEKDHSHFPL